MDLPDTQTGLYTNIKVAHAKLVSNSPDALRMCAVPAITVSGARARVKAEPFADLEYAGEEEAS